jgi:hypothetical protein
MATVHIRISTEGHTTCSLELLTAYFQPANSVFLSQQTSQQYFQPLIFSQDDRDRELHARVAESWSNQEWIRASDELALRT